MATFRDITGNEGVNERYPIVRVDYLTILSNWRTVQDRVTLMLVTNK